MPVMLLLVEVIFGKQYGVRHLDCEIRCSSLMRLSKHPMQSLGCFKYSKEYFPTIATICKEELIHKEIETPYQNAEFKSEQPS